jgi:hypothetical protein
MRKVGRHLGWLLVVVMALGFATVVRTANAAESVPACRPELMQGRWYNQDRNTRWIVEMDIGFDTGVNQCTTHPWVSCGPSLCDWGERIAIDVGEGWIQSVYYVEGFVTRSLSVQLTHSDGVPMLRVQLFSDYADPALEDQFANDTFER